MAFRANPAGSAAPKPRAAARSSISRPTPSSYSGAASLRMSTAALSAATGSPLMIRRFAATGPPLTWSRWCRRRTVRASMIVSSGLTAEAASAIDAHRRRSSSSLALH
jgi:hypothetical protein